MQISNNYFTDYVEEQRSNKRLILQPRMGFSDYTLMRKGLELVHDFLGARIGTITLDSYTRSCKFEAAANAILENRTLNGYPIVAYGTEKNKKLIRGLHSCDFPIQVRHGSPLPVEIFKSIIDAGIDATEGGPISYCLQYGRVPLQDSINAWTECCEMFSQDRNISGVLRHIESFGGCMLGQLCPPALLLTITLIEGLFFIKHGLKSISLSYAQGYSFEQDSGAIMALRRLASEFLNGTKWHVVVYTFMGMFPQTVLGAQRLIEESAKLALLTGSERLIVKTALESHQIPSIESNLTALRWASEVKIKPDEVQNALTKWHEDIIYIQAKYLLELVLSLAPTLNISILKAFQKGYIDIPYCIHSDNKGLSKSVVDTEGNIYWAKTGNIPFPSFLKKSIFGKTDITSNELIGMLSYNQTKYDNLPNCTNT